MQSLTAHHQKLLDEIEYLLKKVDKETFQKMSPAQRRRQIQQLAKIRIMQIEAHPSIYPQGVTGNLRRIAEGI